MALLGKPHPEQDESEGCVARAPSGMSLEAAGNGRPRGMAAAPALAGGQNPAYRPPPPPPSIPLSTTASMPDARATS